MEDEMIEDRVVGLCVMAILVFLVVLLLVVVPLDMYFNNASSNRCKVAGFDKGYAPGVLSHEAICITEGTDDIYTVLK